MCIRDRHVIMMQQALGVPAEAIRPGLTSERDDPDLELIRSIAAGRRDALATLYELSLIHI